MQSTPPLTRLTLLMGTLLLPLVGTHAANAQRNGRSKVFQQSPR